jgi:phosphate-selective porin
LTISGNAAYLSQAQIGDQIFSLYAYGADLFFNTGGLVIEAEYDAYVEDVSNNVGNNIIGSGYYIQGGYLVLPKLELAVRYQQLDPDKNVSDNKLMWTSLGINYYIREHNLKIQGEYIFKNEEGDQINNNLLQVQLQFDF